VIYARRRASDQVYFRAPRPIHAVSPLHRRHVRKIQAFVIISPGGNKTRRSLAGLPPLLVLTRINLINRFISKQFDLIFYLRLTNARIVPVIDKGWQAEFQPDRRDAIRRRTRRKAVIVLNGGWSTINAEILNVSANGALVQLEGIGAFPDAFQLRYDGLKKYAFRVWTRGLKAGVQFEG